jgi:tetratricopeptide (TPR) repeat protein
MKKHALFAIFFALILSIHSRAAIATDTIVAMPFENLSGRAEYNWVGESFTAALADLLDKPGLVGIRPDERNVAYKQEGLPPTAILTRATMIKIAERAGANLMIIGTYRIDGQGRDSSITVTARVIDIREGRLVGKEFNRGGPLIDLQKLQGELAYEILTQRNSSSPYSREKLIADATLAPVGAFENFIKATLTRDQQARIGFLERAIKEVADKNKTKYIAAIFELGRIQYEAGDYKAALEQLTQIGDQDPRYDEAQFYVAVAQDALGQTDKSLAAHQKLAERLPLFEVYNNIGALFIKQKQYLPAINHLKPAVDAMPRDADTLFNLGYAYYLAKDYPKAVDTLRNETRQRVGDGEGFYLLSKALAATNDQAGATQASDQAKKLLAAFAQWETRGVPQVARMKPTFSKINYYRYKREQDERLNGQASVTGLTPQADQLLEASRNAFQQGRNEDALVNLSKLLQVAPQNFEAHLLMGRVYERRGDFERATNALKAAIFWNPKLVAAHVLLGRINVLKNDCQNAQADAGKALQIDANDPDAQALKRLIDEKCKPAGQ